MDKSEEKSGSREKSGRKLVKKQIMKNAAKEKVDKEIKVDDEGKKVEGKSGLWKLSGRNSIQK